MDIFLSILWIALVAVFLWRAFRQRRAIETLRRAETPDCPRIAIIIPARDEEANIGHCLASLRVQTYRNLIFLVIDDHSTDKTAALICEAADKDARIHAMSAPPLPRGWTGKSHACWIAASAAPDDAEWLCFVDADVRAKPELIHSALAHALSKQLDLLSLTPQQELVSFAERLVMPCGFYILSFIQDLRRIQSPESDEATATGQFLLARRSFYFQVGGHAAVNGHICEDTALARLLKSVGGKVLLCVGGDLLATRMYDGWRDLWLGVSKNLVDMLGGAPRTIAISLGAVVCAWAAVALPIYEATLCVGGENHRLCLGLWLSFIGSAAAFAFHVAGARFFRIPYWYGLLFPLGYTVGAAMAIDSVRRKATGRITWKGRVYP